MKKSLLFISALITGAGAFAQSIPNGNFEIWTSASASIGWSNAWNVTSTLPVPGLAGAKPTTDSVAGYVGASAIQVHSALINGSNYAPGISISGANATTNMAITGAPPAVPTITRYGSFPATVRPVTLSGFAKYHSIGTNHGSIAVEVYDGGVLVGGYADTAFQIADTAVFTNFNIPLTYTNTATTVDSIRITLGSSFVTETPTAGDTLVVDMLRFFTCAINPAATLAAPSVISDDGAAGLSAEGTGTLTATTSASYNHTFTFSVPNPSIGTLSAMGVDVSYTISPMDSIVFGAVTTIPGLTFTQGYPGGVVYPNSLYCYSISGNIPATNNVLYQMNIVQTPWGMIHAEVPALSADLGTTTAPIGTLTTPLGPQNVDLTNTTVDSIIIKVGNPVGIADFDVNVGFSVSQNIPNPFDGSTTINFNCATSTTATFVVTDVLGRQVYDTNINATAGSNTFTYSTDLANGTYFFSISDGTNTITRTMVIVE